MVLVEMPVDNLQDICPVFNKYSLNNHYVSKTNYQKEELMVADVMEP